MRKRTIFMTMVAAVAAVMAVSCQKDQNTSTFGARLEKVVAEKVSIEDINANSSYPQFFTAGEQVRINNGSYTIQYSGTEAQINNVATDEGETRRYTAFYPASLVGDADIRTGQITVTLPAVQNYVENGTKQDVALPMAAVIDGEGMVFNFYNLCSLLKVKVHNSTSSAFTVNSICVAASASNISGTATVTPTGTSSDFLTITSGQKTVTLAGINKNIAAGADAFFYVILPKLSTNNIFSFRINTSNGKCVKQMTGNGVQLPRNTIADLQLNVNVTPEGFSVASNRRVAIAPGNLQYQGSSESFRFALNEWDAIGNNPGNTTGRDEGGENGRYRQSAWIDLFAWGTSGYERSPGHITTSDSQYPSSNIDGTDYDWGVYRSILNGSTTDPAGTWRTPTKAEWAYVFNTRTMLSYNGGTVPRYRFCSLNGVNGVLMFPDNFVPMTSEEISLMNAAALTVAQWQTLKDLGCAFLPVTGIRIATRRATSLISHTYDASVDETNEGHYWSSSRSTLGLGTQASSVKFSYETFGTDRWELNATDGTQQHKGCAVRLVKNL